MSNRDYWGDIQRKRMEWLKAVIRKQPPMSRPVLVAYAAVDGGYNEKRVNLDIDALVAGGYIQEDEGLLVLKFMPATGSE